MLPKIPPYEIKREVGQGGTATVYLARQPSLSRMVALKVLPSYFAHDEDLVARFKREATAVASLRHPNIVQVYDFGRAEDWFYLAMEFIEGGSLQEKLTAEGRLGVTESVKLIGQVARGLHRAHERNIVHRDIKPGNILLTPEGDAVITDFGIVKMLEGTAMTRSAAAGIGTAEYMSPEQSTGERVDPRSDLYALGVVFYELLTGRLPFSDDNPMATMHRHVYEEPVSPAVVNPGLRADLAHVVLKLMAKDPADRFKTGEELAEVLTELNGGLPDGEAAGSQNPDEVAHSAEPSAQGAAGSPTLIRHDTRLLAALRAGLSRDKDAIDKHEPSSKIGPDNAGPIRLRPPVFSVMQATIAAVVIVVLGLTSFAVGRLLFSARGQDGADRVKSVPVNVGRNMAAGQADETAASGGKTAKAIKGSEVEDGTQSTEPATTADTATMSRPALMDLAVEPDNFTLTVGQAVQFRAIGFFSDDTSGAQEVRWRLSDQNIAQINPAGVLTALSGGLLQVEAIASIEGTGAVTAGAALELVTAEPIAETPPARVRRYAPRASSAAPAPAPAPVIDEEYPAVGEIPLTID